ncbi:MAG TPA: alkaline phosphatase PhoX [Dermatophilaceae bacterium]|nr:alkaline phosphatase PhoX [Dermatophilaceae bacterium]
MRTSRGAVAAVGGGLAVMAVLSVNSTSVSTAAPVAEALTLRGVPANDKTPGMWSANVLSPGLAEIPVAQGSTRLENGTAGVPFYGYLGDGPMVPLAGTTAEATKTEPDKNTYLVLDGQRGADAGYTGYGRRFLFQGHEGGTGIITRINLDADEAHRVTLMATKDVNGKSLPTFDGSTYDPFAKRLLFTAEHGNSPDGGVWQASLGFPSRVRDISGALGRGGYEGIQNDSAGNVWIVEDTGGTTTAANPNARQPNSFLYRFVPTRVGDLTAGRLQALRVISRRSGAAITFHGGAPDADIKSADRKDLHTYGLTFATRWVTIHDTATDGTTPFDANVAAKASGATPFKRPENGLFRPGSGFGEFFFAETGDTDIKTQAGALYGGFGAVYRLAQKNPGAATGELSMFYRGDARHTGLDNLAFFGRHQVVFAEDAGDTLHTQRNALDSAYLFDTRLSYAARQPVRVLAEGRDASATIDSGLRDAGTPGFQNDGDNEITGIHVSNGDASRFGLLGAQIPRPFQAGTGWRVFYTAQHGNNVTYEVVRDPAWRE